MREITTDQSAPLGKKLIGEIFVKRGLISKTQLHYALDIKDYVKGYLGELLIQLGYVDEQDVVTALLIQSHFPYIAIDRYAIDRKTISLIPKDFARRHCVVPLGRVNNVASFVMANPADTAVKEELERLTGCRIARFIATAQEIEKAIQRGYK